MFASHIYLPFLTTGALIKTGLVKNQGAIGSDTVQTEPKAGPLPKSLEIKYKLRDNRDMTRK